MKTRKIRNVIAAALVLSLVLAIPATAALSKKTIEVYTGASIYIDGVELHPTDVNGNPVETFVYNGTTYVPLRAVSQSLGKAVSYDGATQSVYIGTAPGVKQYLPSILAPYQSEHYNTPTTISMAGKKYANVIDLSANRIMNYREYGGWALYNLNGQYQTLDFDMGHVDDCAMESGTLNIYLDGELSFSVDMNAEDLPKHFTVPLYGALQMKLEMSTGYYAMANVEIY